MPKFSRLIRLKVDTNSPEAKRLFIIFFTGSFLIYLAATNYSRLIVSPWLVGEWLVSYSGGFSRRGFSGSLILGISDVTGLNPLWIVFGFQVILLAGILILLYVKVISQPLPLGVMVALFSPMALSYFLVDPGGVAGRKEYLLFFIAILWFGFQSRNMHKNKIGARQALSFLLFGLAFGVLVLTHEGFLFFFPLLVIPLGLSLLACAKPSLTWVLASLSTLTVPSAAAVAAILFLNSNPTFFQMCTPLTSRQVPEKVCDGAIAWSVNNGSPGLEFALEQTAYFVQNYNLYYIIVAVCLVFAFASFRSLQLMHPLPGQRVVAPALVGSLILTSLPLFLIAHDWGRYISISATLTSFALLFSYTAQKSRDDEFLQLSDQGWLSKQQKARLLLALTAIWFFLGVRSYRGDYLSIAYTWASTIYFALR